MRRKLVIAAVAAFAVAAASSLFTWQLLPADSSPKQATSSPYRHVDLPPLPPGEPREVDSICEIIGESAADIERKATIVFVGTAIGRGGSEVVLTADEARKDFLESERPFLEDEALILTVHRIRFLVEWVFRGPKVDTIDLSAFDCGDPNNDPFVIGSKYVVFADRTTFGSEKTPRTAAISYTQGAFLLEDEDSECPWVARNEEMTASCGDPAQEIPSVASIR